MEDYDTALRLFKRYEETLLSNDLLSAESALTKLTEMSMMEEERQEEQEEEEEEQEAKESCAPRPFPSSFKLTADQMRVKRMMTKRHARSMLLVHGTGRGKTCTAITVAEHFMDLMYPCAAATGDYTQRPLIIVPAHLKVSFVKNLLDVNKLDIDERTGRLASDNVQQCVGSKYLAMVADRYDLTRENLQMRVQAMVTTRFYHIMSHMEFANYIERIEEEVNRMTTVPERRTVLMSTKLRKLFSNRVIVVDEVHNLRVDNLKDDTAKKVPPRLWQTIKAANNVKLLLMSATPMYNDAREIIFLTNLILLNEKQRPLSEANLVFSSDGKRLTESGAQLLRDALRGRVSYVPGMNPYTFPFRLSASFNKDEPVVKLEGIDYGLTVTILTGRSQMALSQALKRSSQIDRDGEGEDEEDEDEAMSDLIVGLQVSNVSFPGDAFPKSNTLGYGAYNIGRCFLFRSPKTNRFSMEYAPGVPHFLSPGLCGEYAPKIHDIVERVATCDGKVLIYSAYKTTGVLVAALALEHRGYTRYPDSPILTSSTPVAKQGSYVMWTGDKTMCCDESHIDVFNSPQNKNGEIIKVLLCTRRGSEGLDMKAIRQVHIMDPWYNMNRIEQIVGRSARHCSHADLDPDKRNVTVYLHASVLSKKSMESLDMHVYKIAAEKQALISRVENTVLKEACAESAMLKTDTVRIKVRQTSSQGVTGMVTVVVPIRNTSNKKKRTSTTVTVRDLMKEYGVMTASEVGDATGMSPSAAAKLMDQMQRDGELVRVGNKYCLKFVSVPMSSKKAIQISPQDNATSVVFQRSDDSLRASFDHSIRRKWVKLTNIVHDMRDKQVDCTEESILDSCVDSPANRDHYLASIAYALFNKTNDTLCSQFLRSAERGNSVYFPIHHPNYFCYVYDIFHDSFLKLRAADDDTIIVDHTTPADANIVADINKEIRSGAERTLQRISKAPQAYGASSPTSKQGFVFKTYARKSGLMHAVVCSQTPNFTTDLLREFVKTKASTKTHMCSVLELVLRDSDRVFRPSWYLAIKSVDSAAL